MNHHIAKACITALSFLSFVGCANSPHKVVDSEKARTSYVEEQEGQSITNAAAKEAMAHNFVEIDFPQASAVLSKSAMTSLDAAIQQARQSGNINQFIVMSWSDSEYPSKNLQKLSKSQRTLAENRNKSVQKYFKSVSNISVETYNMAERPNTLSKWFNTSDTKLKNSLTAAGLPTTGDALQYPSKASHSVILIKVE